MTIRNVPIETRDRLAARAGRAGQSLQEHLRELLIDATRRETVAEVIERTRSAARDAGSGVTVEGVLDDLRADRR